MKEYKIVKPDSMWAYKEKVFEDLFNKYASQGWRVSNVAFDQSVTFEKQFLNEIKIGKIKKSNYSKIDTRISFGV